MDNNENKLILSVLVVLLMFVLVGCGGGENSRTDNENNLIKNSSENNRIVDAEALKNAPLTSGGTAQLKSDDSATDGASLVIPPGAVDQDSKDAKPTIQSTNELPEKSPWGQVPVGSLFELGPSGLKFSSDNKALLTLPIPPGGLRENLYIGRWNEENNIWESVGGTIDGDFISAEVDHLSLYGIFSNDLSLVRVVNKVDGDDDPNDQGIEIRYISGPLPPPDWPEDKPFTAHRPLPEGGIDLKFDESRLMMLAPGEYRFIASYPSPNQVANDLFIHIPVEDQEFELENGTGAVIEDGSGSVIDDSSGTIVEDSASTAVEGEPGTVIGGGTGTSGTDTGTGITDDFEVVITSSTPGEGTGGAGPIEIVITPSGKISRSVNAKVNNGVVDQTIIITADGASSDNDDTNESLSKFSGNKIIANSNLPPNLDCSASSPAAVNIISIDPNKFSLPSRRVAVGPILNKRSDSLVNLTGTAIDPEDDVINYYWTWSGRGTLPSRDVAASDEVIDFSYSTRSKREGLYDVYLTAYDSFHLFDECRWEITVRGNEKPTIKVLADDFVIDFGRFGFTMVNDANTLSGDRHDIRSLVDEDELVFPVIISSLCSYDMDLDSTRLKLLPILPESESPDHVNRPTQYPSGMTCVYALVGDADGDPLQVKFKFPYEGDLYNVMTGDKIITVKQLEDYNVYISSNAAELFSIVESPLLVPFAPEAQFALPIIWEAPHNIHGVDAAETLIQPGAPTHDCRHLGVVPCVDIAGTFPAGGITAIAARVTDGLSREQIGDFLVGFGEDDIVRKSEEIRDQELTACDIWTPSQSGGAAGTVDNWDVSSIPDGASFDIKFNAENIPDIFEVEYPVGTIQLDTGWRGDSGYDGDPRYPEGIQGPGSGEELDIFSKSIGNEIKVTVTGGDSNTIWRYSLRCNIQSIDDPDSPDNPGDTAGTGGTNKPIVLILDDVVFNKANSLRPNEEDLCGDAPDCIHNFLPLSSDLRTSFRTKLTLRQGNANYEFDVQDERINIGEKRTEYRALFTFDEPPERIVAGTKIPLEIRGEVSGFISGWSIHSSFTYYQKVGGSNQYKYDTDVVLFNRDLPYNKDNGKHEGSLTDSAITEILIPNDAGDGFTIGGKFANDGSLFIDWIYKIEK